jgi:LDH2 family malate/lactate/ureidoglycolate dehydrogenase
MERYPAEVVTSLATDIAVAAGVRADDAAILADSLVAADLAGTSTHGVSRLAIYVKRIKKGLIDPRAELKIDRERGATLAVDAGNGLGQVQAVKVLDLLTPKAKAHGVAVATIRNSQHFGALSYYCNLAADRDMILFGTSASEPAMSPEGGCRAYFGTNPIAASFPTDKGFHLKIDLATSIIARGNVIAAQKRGDAIPLGWALDPEGNPTTDASQALAGTILTMAGHKGYALATMVEVFSSVLSGAAVGAAIGSMYKDLDRKQNVGHFFCLLDIDAFTGAAEFKRRMGEMVDEIKSCRRRPGVEEILVPGERSSRTTRDNRTRGIKIEGATLAELRTLCGELGVPFTLSEKSAA